MSVLQHHMTGDTSPEFKLQCLAKHIAHWNNQKREAWLAGRWTKSNGKQSCDELRIAAAEARRELILQRDRQKLTDREVGKRALEELRRAAA